MESEPARRADRVRGLLIVAVAFLAALSVSWWARGVASPESGDPPGPATSDGVVGFNHKVDALATLDAARTHTKRQELRGISVTGVESDGTVDLAKPGARIRYVFTSQRGEGPQPAHPPGTLPRRSFCGRQNVHVRAEGMVADPDQPSAPCPAERGDPLPAPRCGPKQVWEVARAHGAPSDHLATIEYFRAVGGPAWSFEIPGTPHHLVLYGDCERVLSGVEASGSVP